MAGFFLLVLPHLCQAAPGPLEDLIRKETPKVVAWRRHFHQYPELSNREFLTSKRVAEELSRMGLEVKTGVAKTGVVALLRGAKPGPTVALRADMDALPVLESNPLAYASKVTADYNGQAVPVMHACGHDAHVAILLGTAEVLSSLRAELPGTVKFIFQPAEEGPPDGEAGGAQEMVRQGVMDNPKVDVVFGLHVRAGAKLGCIGCASGRVLASDDQFVVKVQGKSAHASKPWAGVDPIVVGSQIVQGFQSIVSRQEDLTNSPVVITVGKVQSGLRYNIIPEELTLEGTIRTFDETIRQDVHKRMVRTATKIAEASEATATVQITQRTLVVFNDPGLYKNMRASLVKAAGPGKYSRVPWGTGAEDFSYYGSKAPSLYFFLGVCPVDQDPASAGGHHTPEFLMDDSRLDVGVRAFCLLVFDYAAQHSDFADTQAESFETDSQEGAKGGGTSSLRTNILGSLTAILIVFSILFWMAKKRK